MWTSRHSQSGAVNEHANAKIHRKRQKRRTVSENLFPQNLTAIVFVVPSRIAVYLVVAHQRLAYARSPMTFEFVFSTFVIAWTVHTCIMTIHTNKMYIPKNKPKLILLKFMKNFVWSLPTNEYEAWSLENGMKENYWKHHSCMCEGRWLR